MSEQRGQDVSQFFDRHKSSHDYERLKELTRAQDSAVAELLNAEVHGRALFVGGVWEFFERPPKVTDISVLDLSAEMAKTYAPAGAKITIGDLYAADFPERSFDSIVFSLLLHHVAQGNWAECERRIQDALSRAKRWLAPGGTVFILEYCPHPAWQPVQRLALPATGLLLRAIGQPLVVMHSRAFYEETLRAGGYSDIRARRIAPAGIDEWTWFPVFMAAPALKMPLKFYPKMHLITGTAA
jgi:SAM-dependent methyltransferase